MTALADAQEAYAAAVETGAAAYDRSVAPARARWDKATRLARESGTRIDEDDVRAWQAACRRAQELYQQITAGPAADVDEALRRQEGSHHDDD